MNSLYRIFMIYGYTIQWDIGGSSNHIQDWSSSTGHEKPRVRHAVFAKCLQVM